jgi:hypothetical protein
MHADQQSAALAIATRPPINVAGKVTPAAKIEIPDAKIRALGNLEGFLKCWQQWFFYVVEDSRHCASPALWLSALAGIVFPRLTAPHPIVDLGNFEFPKATNPMSGQALGALCPSVWNSCHHTLCGPPPADKAEAGTKGELGKWVSLPKRR